jgi:thiamine biosynthesis protein ThiI
MKFVSLISSGIDSPVATYLLSKNADEIIFLHADGKPFNDVKEYNNFLLIGENLKRKIQCNVKTYIIPHGNSLSYYFEKSNNKRYTCIFCKRMLLRYAEKIANDENAEAIIMGDSLGQVASQTLQNIRIIEQAVNIPILRPLIGLDKEDIIKIAKEIKTYDLSILQSEGCNAVPSKPVTKAKLDDILFEENKIDIENLIKDAISNLKIITN